MSPSSALRTHLSGQGLAFATDAADDAAPVAPVAADTVTRNEVTHCDGTKFKRTPQGGIRGPAAPTRVGVFKYRHRTGPMAGKIVREYRPADEVFAADSLTSLEDAPITDGHPDTTDHLVNAENFRQLARGHVTGVKHDETHVLAEAIIQDGVLADRVLRRDRVELSCGYSFQHDWTAGEFNGEPYDVIQRNIRYNHVALLPPGGGRQGSDVALRFDAAILEELTPMLINLDGKDYDMSTEEGRAAYQAAHQAKVDAEKTRADAAEGQLETANAELAPLRAAEAAAARAALVARAKKIAPTVNVDGLANVRSVMEAALGGNLTDKSDDYVTARFDAAAEIAEAAAPVGAKDLALEAARAAMDTPGEPEVPATTINPNFMRWTLPLTASKDK